MEKAGKYSGILRYALQRFRRAEQKRKTVYRKASGASGGAASGTEKECDVILIEADGARRLPLKVPAAWEPVIPEMTDLVIGVIGLDCLGKAIKDTVHRPESAAEFLGKSSEEKITEEDIIRIAESDQGLRKSVGYREFRVFLNKADVLSDRNLPDKIVQRLRKHGIWAACGSLKQDISIVILAAGNSRRFGSNKLFFQ